MRGPLALCSVLSLVACDRVFSLDRLPEPDAPLEPDIDASIDAPRVDLDMDGVPDELDQCLTPPNEGGNTDIDIDGIRDNGDTCPYDGPNGADVDDDGIGLACDPFPTIDDRSRCLMLFSSPVLNSALWPVRPADHPWTVQPLALVADPPILGQTIATTIVAQSIEGENHTRYDVRFQVEHRSQFGSITLWLRANPLGESPGDVGCRYTSAPTGAAFGVIKGTGYLASQVSAGLVGSPLIGRITGSIVTTGALGDPASVKCSFSIGSLSGTVNASPALPEGRFGLMVDRWRVEVNALHVIDQP